MQRLVSRPAVCSRLHQIHLLFNRSVYIIGNHFNPGSSEEIQLTAQVPIADRKYLPSSNSPEFPRFLSGPRENYPKLLKIQNAHDASLKDWGKRAREVIDEAFNKYLTDGTGVALLFRGLPLRDQHDMMEWVTGLGFDFMKHLRQGNAPRGNVVGHVTPGQKTARAYTIELHNDMAYLADHPKLIAIGCFETPRTGGETAICDVRQLASKLDPGLVKKCERKLIRYWQFLPDESVNHQPQLRLSWQEQYGTKDPVELGKILKRLGCSFELDGKSLRSWQDMPPHIFHPKSGERLWFNQIGTHHRSYFEALPVLENVKLPDKRHPYYSHATYADGEEIEENFIEQVRGAAWKSAVGFRWQNGDVLFLDQLIMQHSRLGFDGNRRVGICSMTY